VPPLDPVEVNVVVVVFAPGQATCLGQSAGNLAQDDHGQTAVEHCDTREDVEIHDRAAIVTLWTATSAMTPMRSLGRANGRVTSATASRWNAQLNEPVGPGKAAASSATATSSGRSRIRSASLPLSVASMIECLLQVLVPEH
jgi:hypothetical protein